MSSKIVQLRQPKKYRNATSRSNGRLGNDAYRVREHLTEAEMDKLLAALKRNRHGHRDWLIGLIIYRHGLRVSEACDLRWDDIDLPKRTIIVRWRVAMHAVGSVCFRPARNTNRENNFTLTGVDFPKSKVSDWNGGRPEPLSQMPVSSAATRRKRFAARRTRAP